MIDRIIRTTALSLSLGLMATAAHAASIADTVKQNDQLGRFSEAITTAGLDQQLAGEGPFTVFAPTDQAFEQLPQSVRDQLIKQGHQAELTKLLQHHVVQGQELMAKDVLGKQSKVDTVSGDTLTVDGTTEVVLLVPTGLTITQVGDHIIVEREGMAASAGQIEVRDQQVRKAGDGQQGQQAKQQAQGQQAEQRDQTSAARTTTAEQSDMPMTEHQQEVLMSEPGEERQHTAAKGSAPMPATEHQRQVLAEDELPGEQQQSYEQARVEGKPDLLREATVVEPDLQADNGVIHLIDAVLVPQRVLKSLSGASGQG